MPTGGPRAPPAVLWRCGRSNRAPIASAPNAAPVKSVAGAASRAACRNLSKTRSRAVKRERTARADGLGEVARVWKRASRWRLASGVDGGEGLEPGLGDGRKAAGASVDVVEQGAGGQGGGGPALGVTVRLVDVAQVGEQ